jgi:integrase
MPITAEVMVRKSPRSLWTSELSRPVMSAGREAHRKELTDAVVTDSCVRMSARSLELPKRAIAALTVHKARQANERRAAGEARHDNNLVFCHENGDPYTADQLNWRFSRMTRRAGIGRWHAHEGRHTAVSIMSSNGVPIQEISDTVGHKSTHVTETVYRHVIVPEIRGGAIVMDDVFNDDENDTDEGNQKA